MKILIVDDEPRITRGIKKLITEMDRGHEIESAENGVDGLEKVKEFQPDVIFVDIKMPLMDGLTFGKIVKEEYPDTVFVIISGYAEFDYAQEALKIGVLDYVLKPIMPDKIHEVVMKSEKEIEKIKFETEKSSYYLEKKLLDMISEKYSGTIKQVLDEINNYRIIVGLNENHQEDYNYKISKEEKCKIKTQLIDKLGSETILVFKNENIYIIYYGDENNLENLENSISKIPSNYFRFIISHLYLGDQSFSHALAEVLTLHESEIENNEVINKREIEGISKKIIKYIEENYHKKISLNDIGNLVYMHSTHVSKVFKKETGMNISDYIVNYRIKKAKELLCDPKYKIYDVAYKVGFKGPKYFVRVFKTKTGMTPSQFRKKNLGREL